MLLAALPSLLLLAVVLSPPVNHDVAAVLGFAQRWLAGERLYVDLLDVNPPLVFIISLVPAAVGEALPISPLLALRLFGLGTCALALWLAWRVMRLPDTMRGPVERACLLAGLPLLMLGAAYDFLQREHLMVVASLPWLLLAARRAEGVAPPVPVALGAAVTVFAASGFALKPFFLGIPALVEALVLVSRWRHGARGRALLADPWPWLMAAVWFFYLAVVLLLFPAFVRRILPLVFGFYLHDTLPWWKVAVDERMGTALLALLPLSVLAFTARLGALPRVAALAGLGAAVAALVQGRGWTYHVLPVTLFAGLTGLVLVARWFDRRALPPGRAIVAAPQIAAAAAFALLLFVLGRAEAPWREISWGWSREGNLARALERVAPGGRVLVLSPDIHPVWPALAQAGARTTLAAMDTWIVQGAYARCDVTPGAPRFHALDAMPDAERTFFERTVADFTRDPPAAVLVSRAPRMPDCGGVRFDLLGYFERDPRFAAVFARYREVPDIGVSGYQLFRREP